MSTLRERDQSRPPKPAFIVLEDDLALHGETEGGPQIHPAAHDATHIDAGGREGRSCHLSPAPHFAVDVNERASLELSEASLHLIMRNVHRAGNPSRREFGGPTYVEEYRATRPALHDLT